MCIATLVFSVVENGMIQVVVEEKLEVRKKQKGIFPEEVVTKVVQ